MNRLLEKTLKRLALRYWQGLAEAAPMADLDALRGQRSSARALRRQIDRLIHEAEHRLALPVIGSNLIRKPPGTDWSWRPDLWRGRMALPGTSNVPTRAQLGEGALISHDCQRSELTLRQIRNTRPQDIAPFGIRMDVFRFDGSFLSLSLDLPEEGLRGLRLRHVVRLDVVAEMEKPLEIFARLNIKHGPNLEQMVRELPLDREEVSVEFDLAYSKINEKRVEKIWIDLIFEGPEMNQVILRDVTMTRHPRADL